ncbi:deoxyribonuclease IV [Entomospira culicis]|uniref:Probable endonuclease 4 n=1 Tax=Entomospira culicis TaxID=2719989 RepID=A0A968GGL0_9SPIO|nr:deoxyribonuclease IV [Entomospira culicis]NIZ19969.1 deoxyribonuclease IV [Entomospira culicis]NIZ70166.1 deoxyribonuclease IV [Entomospira culicis]WDI37999.1 deoxyribonuclease IV [Entomospira culicis]WDI39622.1 deoxyribonuclease IV [Entomospira culicis]
MFYYGAHVSTAGGLANAPKNAQKIDANAFAMFTRNPRGWQAPPLSEKDISAFKEALVASKIDADKVLVHDNYLVNLATDNPEIRQKSINSLLDELERVEALGLHLLNFHPGARLKSDLAPALARIAEAMRFILDHTKYATLVIEATAGSGSHTGATFEELATILEYFKGNDQRVGVCIDTAHIFAAGYDLRTEDDYHQTMQTFGEVVGFSYLKGMHINDSLKAHGSRVDRHASLGAGEIGWTPFQLIAKDKRLEEMPLILETPEPTLWAQEIAFLRSQRDESPKRV